MNAQEVGALIDYCVATGSWARPSDEAHLQDQIAAWSIIVGHIPAEFAMRVATEHSGPYSMRPSFIRGAWEEHEKAEKRTRTYSENACAWVRLCSCPHIDCMNGQMLLAEDKATVVDAGRKGTTTRFTTGITWCHRCWDARNLRREELGKEPREYGDTRP